MVCGCLRLFAVVEEPEGWPQRDAKKTQKEEEMSGRGRWTLDAGRWTLDAGGSYLPQGGREAEGAEIEFGA